ncbi:MAG: Na+/H+ antiporter subunit C [Azospirillum sp.]|nr:Na+/H+ antiporter subunit C [Azospirillum sp.]
MASLLAVLIGAMVAAASYLLLSRNVVRFLFGFVLLGNAINLAILTVGRYRGPQPPLVPDGAAVPTAAVANALPQALILTAIVIGFGILAFSVVLIYRAYEELGTINSDEMQVAEPAGVPGGPR